MLSGSLYQELLCTMPALLEALMHYACREPRNSPEYDFFSEKLTFHKRKCLRSKKSARIWKFFEKIQFTQKKMRCKKFDNQNQIFSRSKTEPKKNNINFYIN
jgi:hypothetical protein